MKKCSSCSKDKPLKEFYDKGSKCKTCLRKYDKERRNSLSVYVRTQKEANPCCDCNKFFPYYCMDFDHVGVKTDTLNSMIKRKVGLDVIKKEISECELVCANCHRKRTHHRRQNENSKR